MALLAKNVETPFGIILDTAYFKILTAGYTDNTQRIFFEGDLFLNEEYSKLGAEAALPFGKVSFDFISDDKETNFIHQAYEYIKMECKRMEGKTLEEVNAWNQAYFDECATNNVPPTESLKVAYYYLIGAEDC